MKKLFILGLILFVVCNCTAQNNILIGISIKPQVYSAIGNNYVFVTNTDSREAKINLSGGLTFDYRLNESFSILSGVFYQPHGISKEFLQDLSHRYFESTIRYIRVPFLTSFNILENRNMRLNIITGLGINYMIYARDNMQYLANFFTDGNIDPSIERYNKTMLDGQFSLGLEKPISNRVNFLSQADIVMGITRFHSKYSDIIMDSRVSSFGISIGIKYGFD